MPRQRCNQPGKLHPWSHLTSCLRASIAPLPLQLMLFGGFYANVQTIPAVLRWSE